MTSKRLKRKFENREERKILIVCEGEKTEPNYFKKFPINNKEVKVVNELNKFIDEDENDVRG